ncbi:MAG: DNA repair protein RecN [Phycisphaerae bacterium]
MLSKLFIKNLAIIEELEIEFAEGFNVFTGQTGAGKSLIIGALGLLLGFRQTSATVRPNASEALISAVFDLPDDGLLTELAQIINVPIEDGEFILQRRIMASGKTVSTVNSIPIPASTLKQIGEILVDVHGQHENQYLLRPNIQLRLLDIFTGCTPTADEFAEVHRQWHEAIKRKQDLMEHAELRGQQIDLYEFQLQEIDQAELKPGERQEIEARLRQLSNVEKIRELADTLINGLEESEFPVIDQLRSMHTKTNQLAQIDNHLKDLPGQINSAITELDDVAKTVANYLDQLESDPQRLAELDNRLALLMRLGKKYGQGDIEMVLPYRQEIAQKLDQLKGRQNDFDSIDEQIGQLARKREKIGNKLSESRRKAALKLSTAVNKQLNELAMPNAKFQVDFIPAPPENPSPLGLETVEFMIQTNPGQPVLPIRKIASAGELSRIMLGIKSILASPGRSSVLVFDEVDSNVGGRLGEVIGTKIAKLAAHQQVICISHLPQLAAFADRHFVVAKQSTKKETISFIQTVTGEDRVAEIAEMISGKNKTETTLRQAKEMLNASQKM